MNVGASKLVGDKDSAAWFGNSGGATLGHDGSAIFVAARLARRRYVHVPFPSVDIDGLDCDSVR